MEAQEARRHEGRRELATPMHGSGNVPALRFTHTGRVNNHRKLRIWRQAGDLVVACYELTSKLPPQERYVADPQLRRAAWSVQNNIAEGNARLGPAERRRFFDCSLASLAEIDSMIGTLGRLYSLDTELVSRINRLRFDITAGIFAVLKGPGRKRRPV